MIRDLRRKHLYIFVILAALLPVAYIAGLAARRLPPPMDSFPPALQDEIQTLPATPVNIKTRWTAYSIETRLLKNETRSVLELTILETIPKPDLLLYWAAAPATDAKLPEGAFLLGAISATDATRLTAPATSGYLFIYSLGHNEIVSSSEYTL